MDAEELEEAVRRLRQRFNNHVHYPKDYGNPRLAGRVAGAEDEEDEEDES